MLIPIRCFSCNNPISRYYLEYLDIKKHKKDVVKFFEEKKIRKYCCQRMILTHVDTYKLIKKEEIIKD